MVNFLTYTQLVISVLLIISVLLQNRGSGLSAAFGGDFGGFHTKRGIEKFLFVASAILGGLFILNALVTIILSVRG